jgi:nickel/cobalt exporter
MLRMQMRLLPAARPQEDSWNDRGDVTDAYAHNHRHEDDHPHPHSHDHGPHYHSHGWGLVHTHDIDAITQVRPRLAILLGLGIAGGLLPDPGALAILLAAIGSGKLILGLLTVLVFSLGFASVLVVVGVVADVRRPRLIEPLLQPRATTPATR